MNCHDVLKYNLPVQVICYYNQLQFYQERLKENTEYTVLSISYKALVAGMYLSLSDVDAEDSWAEDDALLLGAAPDAFSLV